MYLGFSVLGLIFLTLTLPETKGKDLEEIEGIFAKSWIVPDKKLPSLFKRRDSGSPFSYVHIDGSNSNSNLAAQSSSADTERTSRPSTEGESVVDDAIDTKLCTNRQLSTTDEGEEFDEDSDEDSLS